MADRSPTEIRSSIESNRMELAVSRHRSELQTGAALVGLALGVKILRGRRRRRRER
jgi:hypothetical protein